MREAQLRGHWTFAIRTIDSACKNNVILLNASRIAEAAGLMQPVLDLAVHGAPRPDLAHNENVPRSKHLRYLLHRAERTGRLPGTVPNFAGDGSWVTFAGENPADVDADARTLGSQLLTLGQAN